MKSNVIASIITSMVTSAVLLLIYQNIHLRTHESMEDRYWQIERKQTDAIISQQKIIEGIVNDLYEEEE